jgi:Ni,Fe-hydrogenase I cytochrome b subunit
MARRYQRYQRYPSRDSGDNAGNISSLISLLARCFILIPLAGIIVFTVIGYFRPLLPPGPWMVVMDAISALARYNLFVFGFVFVLLILFPLLWIFFGGDNRPNRW